MQMHCRIQWDSFLSRGRHSCSEAEVENSGSDLQWDRMSGRWGEACLGEEEFRLDLESKRIEGEGQAEKEVSSTLKCWWVIRTNCISGSPGGERV